MARRLLAGAVRVLRQRVRTWTEPLPMTEFADYDAYWVERGDVFGGDVVERWRLAAESIPDGAAVLDVGCGSGEFLTHLRQVRPNVIAEGADFSQVAVDATRARGFEAFRLDLEHEDVPRQYDYITCFETLEHIPDAETAVMRLAAACRHQLLVSVPNVGYLDSRIRLGLFGRFPNTNCIYHVKEHVRHWTLRDFHDWSERCGLRVVRYAGQYPGQFGGRFLPWRRWPGLFSPGLFYVLESGGPRPVDLREASDAASDR